MDMDSLNMLEGSCWISEVTKEETQLTFEREGVQNQREWSKIRERSSNAIDPKLKMNFQRSIRYSSLLEVVRQSWVDRSSAKFLNLRSDANSISCIF
jgi:hypothetical protein